MRTATIWNSKSTNYEANSFVRVNGTESFEVGSQAQAIELLLESVFDESIKRLHLELEEGTIIWVRNPTSETCECEDCDECSDRWDFPEDGELEKFKQDTEEEDYDINDPRR